MSLETVPWDYTANLHMPLKKKPKTVSVEWTVEDLPTLPILVNKKALKKHTRVVLYQQVPKRQSGESRSSKDGGSKESSEAR